MSLKSASIVVFLFLEFLCASVKAQENDSTGPLFYKKSLTFHLNDLSYDGGLGGTFWLSERYSILLIVDGSYSTNSVTINNQDVILNNVVISPTISFRRHLFMKENVTPYVGITLQPNWYVGDYSRRTALRFGIILGVESWLSENITLAGQQSFLNEITLNQSLGLLGMYGRSSLFLSFYF